MPSVAVLLIALATALTLAGRRRARVYAAVRRFFTEPGGPFNLAIARIAFFSVVLSQTTAVGLKDVQDYSRLPVGLITPPHNLGGLLADLPITPVLVTVAWGALLTAGLLGLLGVFPRLSALIVVIAGFYYLGVPQLYGYVKHDQHILWIGAIFTVSPSGDALSLQSVWQGWRQRSGRAIPGPGRGVQYTLPLRFIWLTMGVLYLSAGSAKYRFDGLRWLEPATLRYWMHELWLQDGNYRPPLIHRPDKFSPFLTLGAAYTLVFELTFLFWLFSRRARPFLGLAGLIFHNSTNLFLKIPFWSLQAFYVTLFDWERFSRLAFRRRAPMQFVYDERRMTCTKAVGALQALVLPGSMTFVTATEQARFKGQADGPSLGSSPGREARLIVGERTFVGYAAYRRLARRVPALWPIWMLLSLPVIGAIGERIYRRIATHGTDREHRASEVAAAHATIKRVIVVGTALLLVLLGVVLAGLRSPSASRASVDGWPFASYPSFAQAPITTADQFSVLALSSNGLRQPVNLRRRLAFISADRMAGLTSTILDQSDPGRKRAELVDLVCAAGLPTSSTQAVVYWQKVLLDPDRAGQVVSSTKLLEVAAAPHPQARRDAVSCQR